VDDRQVVSGIIYVIRHGLQLKDARRGYGPHKTPYNRFIRGSRLGVFARIFTALAAAPERLMTDATDLKAHRTVAILLRAATALGHLHRSHRRILARIVRPEPKLKH
jgi:transposase